MRGWSRESATFFAARGVLEVETPLLGARGAMDPAIESFSAVGPGRKGALASDLPGVRDEAAPRGRERTRSTRSLARFRAGEEGPRHNPEFTLLEWYRPGYDHHRLMEEVGELVVAALGCPAPRRIAYARAFRELAGVDIDRASDEALRERARKAGADKRTAADLDRDGCLDLLLAHFVQPGLSQLVGSRAVFLHDYPASQAALARVARTRDGGRAERFELFVDGVELANGYHELTDPAEQRRRFEAEAARRRDTGLPVMEMDERLIAALAHGLPACAGVALGLDRLVMLALGFASVEDVIAFPDAIA